MDSALQVCGFIGSGLKLKVLECKASVFREHGWTRACGRQMFFSSSAHAATASGGLDGGHLDILTFLSWSLMVTHQLFGNGNPSKNLGNMRQKPRNIGVWRSQPPSPQSYGLVGEGSQRGPGSYVNPTQTINPIT